jgi:hypothetical protein
MRRVMGLYLTGRNITASLATNGPGLFILPAHRDYLVGHS